MRLVEFLKITEREVRRKKRRIDRDEDGNMHDDANVAQFNNAGTFGMKGGFSFSPGEHPGILLPDEADPTGGDGIPDRMSVVKKS